MAALQSHIADLETTAVYANDKIAALESTGGTFTLKVPEYDTILERLTAIENRLQTETESYAELLGRIEQLEKVMAWQESE
jgi:hypothetical protein